MGGKGVWGETACIPTAAHTAQVRGKHSQKTKASIRSNAINNGEFSKNTRRNVRKASARFAGAVAMSGSLEAQLGAHGRDDSAQTHHRDAGELPFHLLQLIFNHGFRHIVLQEVRPVQV